MIPAKQNIIRKFSVLGRLVLLSLLVILVAGQTSRAETGSSIDRLLKESGFDQDSPFTSKDIYFEYFRELQLGDGEIQSLKNIIARYYVPASFVKTLNGKLNKKFKPNYAKSLEQWYQSPLGKKILSEEIKAAQEGTDQEIQKYFQAFQNDPSYKKRLEQIDKLKQVKNLLELSKENAEIIMQLTFPYRNLAEGRSLIQNRLESLSGYISQTLLHRYRNLSTAELEQYIDFLESPAQTWFDKEYQLSRIELIDASVDKGIGLLNKVVSQIQSGQGGVSLLKEIFPPGERYRLIVQRDPFSPLVSTRRASGKDKEEKLTSRRKKKSTTAEKNLQRMANLGSRLPPIPVEILKQMKDAQPELLAQLEHYAGIFSNRRKLLEMDDETFNANLTGYKKLIRSANQFRKTIALTPLQTDYKKFKLVGILKKGSQKVAMIQTQNMGLTIKKGVLIGPDFGIVERIDTEKVVILEQVRDYTGNIFSKKKELKFSNNRKDRSEARS
ncbi:MAG: hypothetical protein COV66_15635 [Nitrospinae bacterium CG11_big_fil_rev_8_21_14_0_20_45_15]|nr:MAG: hypothetical protein COV66_15635 [Nitrospinae bacterium CG11_big_fil_rev_8_21_14_0_20_45_15]